MALIAGLSESAPRPPRLVSDPFQEVRNIAEPGQVPPALDLTSLSPCVSEFAQ
jgi:hypothetical protein